MYFVASKGVSTTKGSWE